MKENLFLGCFVLLVVAFITVPAMAATPSTAAASSSVKPFDWKTMCAKTSPDLSWLPSCDLLKMTTAETSARQAADTALGQQIKSIQLTPGPTGSTGPTGPKGDKGDQGPQGIPGTLADQQAITALQEKNIAQDDTIANNWAMYQTMLGVQAADEKKQDQVIGQLSLYADQVDQRATRAKLLIITDWGKDYEYVPVPTGYDMSECTIITSPVWSGYAAPKGSYITKVDHTWQAYRLTGDNTKWQIVAHSQVFWGADCDCTWTIQSSWPFVVWDCHTCSNHELYPEVLQYTIICQHAMDKTDNRVTI